MVALIVITSIILYIFVVIVLVHVTTVKLVQRCGCNERRFCDYDHAFNAGLFAVLWPVSYIAVALGLGLYAVATMSAEWVIDKTNQED